MVPGTIASMSNAPTSVSTACTAGTWFVVHRSSAAATSPIRFPLGPTFGTAGRASASTQRTTADMEPRGTNSVYSTLQRPARSIKVDGKIVQPRFDLVAVPCNEAPAERVIECRKRSVHAVTACTRYDLPSFTPSFEHGSRDAGVSAAQLSFVERLGAFARLAVLWTAACSVGFGHVDKDEPVRPHSA